ncbi:class III lanthionine synthetase LanKC N-terminal domain-containing protein [Actinomadura macrotermitis]|uniref:class III lanthionine synthetase LanKC N-terminal domain-containing protein n=1 Tax=Actinomadura macrotermitis TaxID=2585200 RepID=UPI0012967462|nr:protein kinase/lanthionine synthetase C family protein [Actinomadura macrotermitis]
MDILERLGELSARGLRLRRGEVWIDVQDRRTPIPEQGWKLHVAARPATLGATLDRALPVLLSLAPNFKVVGDAGILREFNSPSNTTGSAGKAITVYPAQDSVAAVGHALVAALHGLAAPIIRSDRRISPDAPVYYRYGPFRPRYRMTGNGDFELVVIGPSGELFPGAAGPTFRCPDWAEDPFPPHTEAHPADQRPPTVHPRTPDNDHRPFPKGHPPPSRPHDDRPPHLARTRKEQPPAGEPPPLKRSSPAPRQAPTPHRTADDHRPPADRSPPDNARPPGDEPPPNGAQLPRAAPPPQDTRPPNDAPPSGSARSATDEQALNEVRPSGEAGTWSGGRLPGGGQDGGKRRSLGEQRLSGAWQARGERQFFGDPPVEGEQEGAPGQGGQWPLGRGAPGSERLSAGGRRSPGGRLPAGERGAVGGTGSSHRPQGRPGVGWHQGSEASPVLGGRYRLTAGIASAARGSVYRAVDMRTGHEVVIKQARAYIGEIADGTDVRANLRNERRILHALAGADGFPRFVDHFRHGEDEFLVVTSAGDRDLRQDVVDHGRYGAGPERSLADLARRLVALLDTLHAHGVVYRDLAPKNITLDEHGRCRLVDFDISRFEGTQRFGWSPGYSPPGQRRDRPAEPEDDYYALGATLFYAATGLDPVRMHDDGERNAAATLIALGAFGLRDEITAGAIPRLLSADPRQRVAAVSDLRRCRRDAVGAPPPLPDIGDLDGLVDHVLGQVLHQARELMGAAPGRPLPTNAHIGTAGIGMELLHHAARPEVRELVGEMASRTRAEMEQAPLGHGLLFGGAGALIFLAAADGRFRVGAPLPADYRFHAECDFRGDPRRSGSGPSARLDGLLHADVDGRADAPDHVRGVLRADGPGLTGGFGYVGGGCSVEAGTGEVSGFVSAGGVSYAGGAGSALSARTAGRVPREEVPSPGSRLFGGMDVRWGGEVLGSRLRDFRRPLLPVPAAGPMQGRLGAAMGGEPALPRPAAEAKDDHAQGVAGTGVGHLILARLLDDPRHLERAAECAARIVQGRVRRTAGELPAAPPGSGVHAEYGMAHGLAGVAYFLLAHARAGGTSPADAERRYARLAAEVPSLIAAAGTPAARPMAGSWCQGLAGIGTSLLAAWAWLDDDRYLEPAGACGRAALRIAPSMAVLSQCCGMAGVGELLIDLALATRSEEYLAGARRVLALMLARCGGEPDRPVFPDHSLAGAAAQWGVGTAGVLTFLRRLRDMGGQRPWTAEWRPPRLGFMAAGFESPSGRGPGFQGGALFPGG